MAEDTDTPETEPDVDPDPEPEPEKVKAGDDWQTKARKHERALKREREAREDAERKLRDREELEKSEFEKAVEQARQEGEKVARTAADKERRADRLETAAVRLAATGIKTTGADGEETTVKFADPDDAHANIERMIRRGDLDEADIFDDNGKISQSGLAEALTDLLKQKPHLAATVSASKPVVAGTADGGKGSAGGGIADMTVEQHFERIRQKR